MAIGEGTNNEKGKLFENTYYSRLRIRQSDNKLNLGISYRSGLMVLTISELQGSNGFNYKDLETIHLSPTKAKLFADEIRKFTKYYNNDNIEEGKAFGVNAGMGEKVSYIGIHANKEREVFITIGKIDGSGQILSQTTITLNKEYHFSLEWENINTMNLSKVFNDNIEISQLVEALDDFGRSMNGAFAYSSADLTRYDTKRILSKMDPIYDKLGIERLQGNNNSRSNSFLNNAGSLNSNHTSIEDMEELLG